MNKARKKKKKHFSVVPANGFLPDLVRGLVISRTQSNVRKVLAIGFDSVGVKVRLFD